MSTPPSVLFPVYVICDSNGLPGIWTLEGHDAMLAFEHQEHAELRLAQMGAGWQMVAMGLDELRHLSTGIPDAMTLSISYMTTLNPQDFLLISLSQFIGKDQ